MVYTESLLGQTSYNFQGHNERDIIRIMEEIKRFQLC